MLLLPSETFRSVIKVTREMCVNKRCGLVSACSSCRKPMTKCERAKKRREGSVGREIPVDHYMVKTRGNHTGTEKK